MIGAMLWLPSAMGMNRLGGTLPFSGWCPAQQRLEALDAEIGEIDDRLVMDFHFIVRQRLAQVALDLLVLEQAALHLGVEQPDAVAPCGLGFIERHVGMAQQLVGIAGFAGDGNADRAADIDLDGVDEDRLADGGDQLFGRRDRFRFVLDRQGDDELVAAEAGDPAAALVHDRETVRDSAQHGVASGMGPSVSLICLKRSRSSQRIAIGRAALPRAACRDWS